MTSGHIPAALRLLITDRAGGRCEYCRLSAEASLFTFQIEHIIAEKHGGTATTDNLALAGPVCNRFKGSDLGSIDPETAQLTPFFNPRAQHWLDHFELDGATIVPLTAVGRVTALILQLNLPDRLLEREALIRIGRYPWASAPCCWPRTRNCLTFATGCEHHASTAKCLLPRVSCEIRPENAIKVQRGEGKC